MSKTPKEKKAGTRIVRSAVTNLFPVSILESGDTVSDLDLNAELAVLSNFVRSNAQQIWAVNSQKIIAEVNAIGTRKIRFKQRFLRDDCGLNTTLPRQTGVLTGNLREIIEHKTLSESETWIRNPDPHKQPFTFNHNVDLSATNDHLSSIQMSEEGNIAVLQFRCMSKRYILTFQLPAYLARRKLRKISKPRIRLVSAGNYCFDFTVEEEITGKTGKLKAGVDLGKIEPYVAVVTTAENRVAAQYYASAGLKSSWAKYRRLSELSSQLQVKEEAYKKLGLDCKTLKAERAFVVAKKTRLHAELSKRQAHELASKLSAHDIATVNVESLLWLAGSKGTSGKGGKWSYGRQQADLTHSLARCGSKVKAVSPKNSSQLCCNCSAPIQHKKNRTVWCSDCKTTLDRDFNAALNIATLNHLKKKEQLVDFCGVIESNCTAIAEVAAEEIQPQAVKVQNLRF